MGTSHNCRGGTRPIQLERFCREALPAFTDAADGRRALAAAKEIVATERWNSFARFRRTTCTLVRRFKAAGADAEVFRVPTGGLPGSGRWMISNAWDIVRATLDVVCPIKIRILDYRDNPWHVIQLSGSTPRGGGEYELVVIDSEEQLARVRPDGRRHCGDRTTWPGNRPQPLDQTRERETGDAKS